MLSEKAVAVLVDAALKGVPQIQGRYHDGYGGSCAVGVLHAAIPNHKPLNFCGECGSHLIMESVQQAYGITEQDCRDMLQDNDVRGIDFLTIARKRGA